MKPIQLSAHTRPIRKVRINRDGDIVFSVGLDQRAMAWYSNNGERLGTYDGHAGAINDFAIDFDTKYCLTASADCRFGVWEACTGKLMKFVAPKEPERCQAVAWACGDKKFCVATTGNKMARLFIYDFTPEKWTDSDYEPKPLAQCPQQSEDFTGHTAKIAEVLWGPVNECLFTASADGTIRRWRSEDGHEERSVPFNPNGKVEITSLSYSKDRVFLVASGKDMTARIFETSTLKQLKVFKSDKPLNCACLHPKLNLVMVVGGQSARDVTTTAHTKGKFEIQFYHTVFEEKVGEIRTGHFSPINYLAVSADGTHFATGAEEGNVRLFKFENDFESKFQSLEKSFVEVGN